MLGSPRVVSPDEALLSLPFDHYERYALSRRLADYLFPNPRVPIRILDVGGHVSSLKHFLPDDVIALADVQPPPRFTYREQIPFRYDHYVVAAGEALPFRDGSFDLVTAHDTLEHVPADRRPAFLRDIFRVSRRFVIVNGPVHDDRSAAAEQRLARFMKHAELGHNVSLDEHLALGLPAAEDIEAVIQEQGLQFAGIPNGNLALWLLMMSIKHYLVSLPHSDELHEETDRIYNSLISPAFGGTCYRRAYVIATRREDEATLAEVEAALSTSQVNAPATWEATSVEQLVDQLQDHSGRIRADLRGLQTKASELGTALRRKEKLLEKKSRQVAELEEVLAETEGHLRALAHEYQLTTQAVGFRVLQRARGAINWVFPPGSWRRGAFRLWRRAFEVGLTEGWLTLLKRSLAITRWGPRVLRGARMGAPQATSIDDQYQIWLAAHALSPADVRRMRREAASFEYRPTVSIVTPTYNTDPAQLREAIESVLGQYYDRWELCVADDASSRPEVREVLREYESADDRIKVVFCEVNGGISAASNAALALATGEFIGLLDHDDELKPNALYEVVKLLNENPDLDFIYSDEDKRDADGRLVQPFFKPDWSPDLLLCENYVPHFAVYRRRIVEEAGGFRSECDFSQDYDLVLRVTERTDRISHIALPLYTWRMIPGSAALESDAKPKAVEAARRALADAIQRRSLDAEVLEGPHPNTYRVRYRIKGQPLVSIIIPTRDRVELLRACIASIEGKSTYPNYEIIIVDNDSADPATLDYLKSSPHGVIPYPGPFHYAAMMNFAVREAAGEHVLLLNNDTEVITPGWIESMLEHSQRPEAAAVGARLLYPDGRPQHEGIIIGLGGGSALNADHRGYFGLGELVLNCSAVTGACMMAGREIWDRMGGFDETLGIAFNDVDYCLRAREEGLLIVYTPFAVLYHHESATRGTLHPEEDEQFFRKRWGKPGEYRDPYYNPNLSLIRPFNLDI